MLLLDMTKVLDTVNIPKTLGNLDIILQHEELPIMNLLNENDENSIPVDYQIGHLFPNDIWKIRNGVKFVSMQSLAVRMLRDKYLIPY